MINLPEVDLIDTDPQQIINDIVYTYEQTVGRTVSKASPEFVFITTIAYTIVLQRQQYEAALKQNLLYYANGDMLDQLGAFRMTPRLDAQGAITTLKFDLSAMQTSSIVIPKGTRATSDNVIYFATDENLVINAGQMSGTVSAKSLQTGEESNNIQAGEVRTIVDPVAFVQSVTNTETTLGGRSRESDESYRERIYNAPAVFSIAGPRDAYAFLAKAASSAIGEVTVTSDKAGTVNVFPLLINGEIPNDAIIDLVKLALNENTVRPLADNVKVEKPTVKQYDIDLTYYIDISNAGNVTIIQDSVDKAINNWVLWQRQKIGRDINISELICRVVSAGAKRVDIANPVTTVIQDNELAILKSKKVTFGGLEDE